jgi:hypothetical protein
MKREHHSYNGIIWEIRDFHTFIYEVYRICTCILCLRTTSNPQTKRTQVLFLNLFTCSVSRVFNTIRNNLIIHHRITKCFCQRFLFTMQKCYRFKLQFTDRAIELRQRNYAQNNPLYMYRPKGKKMHTVLPKLPFMVCIHYCILQS